MTESNISAAAIAIKHGKTNNDNSQIGFFDLLDNTIKRDGDLSDKVQRKASTFSKFEDLIVQKAEQARDAGITLATKPIEVFLSYPEQEVSPGEFTVGEAGVDSLSKTGTFKPLDRLKRKLKKADLPVNGVNLHMMNDGAMQLLAAIEQFKGQLDANDTIYHAINDGGTGLVSTKLTGEKKVGEVRNEEYGHKVMPGVNDIENLAVEGLPRAVLQGREVLASAEPYTSVGDGQDPNYGIKATAMNVMNYFKDGAPDGFAQAIEEYGSTVATMKQAALDSLDLEEMDVTGSSLFERYNSGESITDQDVIDAALASDDNFATALCEFTDGRIADFIINAIEQDKAASVATPKLITINGVLAEGLAKLNDTWANHFVKPIKQRIGQDALVELMPVEMDGTVDLARSALEKLKSGA